MEKNNIQQQLPTEQLSHIITDLLSLSKKLGASDAAVCVHNDLGFSVDVRMADVDTVTFHEDKSISIVVFNGNKQGSASTCDLSKKGLEDMVNAAITISKVSSGDPCFGLPDKEDIIFTTPDLDLYHPWEIDPKAAIEKAIACEDYARSIDNRIHNSNGVSVSSYVSSYGYANTYGFLGWINSSHHSISCSLIAKDMDNMQRGDDYTTSVVPSHLRSIESVAQIAAQNAIDRLGAKALKTQKSPVIFSPKVSGGLILAFINAISGTQLYQKNSFLLDKIGQQIFPNFIKIYEEPHLLRGLDSAPFDNEGILTRPNVFIQDGILKQYVLSTYSARRLGLKTTANAGGVYNLTVSPTVDLGLTEIIKQMDTGFVVTELMGQGINILTGDYSRGMSGFYVKNGEIQHAVEEMVIAGNLANMYKDIVLVGNDIDKDSSVRCGSILIKEMTVSGV